MNIKPSLSMIRNTSLATAVLCGALGLSSLNKTVGDSFEHNKPYEIRAINEKEGSAEWYMKNIENIIEGRPKDEKELAHYETIHPERARHFRYNKNATVIQNAKQALTVAENNIFDNVIDPLTKYGPYLPLGLSVWAFGIYTNTIGIELKNKGVFKDLDKGNNVL